MVPLILCRMLIGFTCLDANVIMLIIVIALRIRRIHYECIIYVCFYSYDYVEIYDGSEELSDKLGRFCGSRSLSPFVSTGNELLIKFRSDDTVSWKGFLATYYFVDRFSEESIAPPQTPVNRTSTRQTKTKGQVEGVDTMIINTAESGRNGGGSGSNGGGGSMRRDQLSRRRNRRRRRRH